MINKEKLTFIEKLKVRFSDFKDEFNNPTKIKIKSKNALIFSGSLLRTLILIGLIFIILLPIFQKFSFSLRHPMDISNPQVVWIPEKIDLINFEIGWKLLDYSKSLFNTTILSLISMFIQVIATAIAGYSFARLKFKGNNVLFYVILFTLVVPNETLHVARLLFFNNIPFFGINLTSNIFSMYIMSAFGQGIRSAIFIYLFRQFFRNLPAELEESAQVDGAGVIRTFWSVMLPNARGAIITVLLFSFVWQWNDFYFANLFQFSNNNFPVFSTQLANGTSQLFTVIGTWIAAGEPFFKDLTDETVRQNPLFYGLIANTAALMMMFPLLIGYIFFQRKFVESIERTGIVG